jgi:hypothetical protein
MTCSEKEKAASNRVETAWMIPYNIYVLNLRQHEKPSA